MKQNAIVIDLDGTLIDNEHKYHECVSHKNEFDFRKFMENTIDDKPCRAILEIASLLYWSEDYIVIFLTARHEDYRDVTLRWLNNHLDTPEKLSEYLYMRVENQDEKVSDSDSKQKNLDIIKNSYNVILAIDDREENIQMFKRNNIKCLQVV